MLFNVHFQSSFGGDECVFFPSFFQHLALFVGCFSRLSVFIRVSIIMISLLCLSLSLSHIHISISIRSLNATNSCLFFVIVVVERIAIVKVFSLEAHSRQFQTHKIASFHTIFYDPYKCANDINCLGIITCFSNFCLSH